MGFYFSNLIFFPTIMFFSKKGLKKCNDNKKKSLTAKTQFYIFLESLVPPISQNFGFGGFIIFSKVFIKICLI
ncbi:MAG: hypothetical protein CM15mP29_3650 [Alphaproteobacteria bacterium]|nr:MAG: hypothetical protein CM15mP29_3650 [Alphaproteobacteria bacterium]